MVGGCEYEKAGNPPLTLTTDAVVIALPVLYRSSARLTLGASWSPNALATPPLTHSVTHTHIRAERCSRQGTTHCRRSYTGPETLSPSSGQDLQAQRPLD